MKEIKLKVITALAVIFIIDMLPLVHYCLNTDFLMLGIISLALNMPYRFVILLSLGFGMAKDVFNLDPFPVYALTFAAMVMLIKYLDRRFPKKGGFKFIIIAAAIIFNLVISSAMARSFSLSFSVSFIFQSFIIFLLLDYSLRKWICELPEG